MITVEGVSYIGSTVVSKTIRLGSIPSTPAKDLAKFAKSFLYIKIYGIVMGEN